LQLLHKDGAYGGARFPRPRCATIYSLTSTINWDDDVMTANSVDRLSSLDPWEQAAVFSAGDRSTWNLIFADAVKQVGGLDRGRLRAPFHDRDRFAAERPHPKVPN